MSRVGIGFRFRGCGARSFQGFPEGMGPPRTTHSDLRGGCRWSWWTCTLVGGHGGDYFLNVGMGIAGDSRIRQLHTTSGHVAGSWSCDPSLEWVWV